MENGANREKRQSVWKKQGKLEWIGIPMVYALACVLHFLYDWTGGSVWAGVFGAANESVWEHMKIFGAAYLLFAVVEFLWHKPPVRRFVVAKAAGLWFLVLAIPVFFYLYTSVVGRHVLAVDLILSAAWVAVAFAISWILQQEEKSERWFGVSVLAIILFLVCYLSFTVNPPDWALFEDPVTGTFGLPGAVESSTIPV